MIQVHCKKCGIKYHSGINLSKGSQIGHLTIQTNCPKCGFVNEIFLDGMYYLNELGVLTKVGSLMSKIGNSDVSINEFLTTSRNLNIANHQEVYKYLDYVKSINIKLYDLFNQIKLENSNLSIAVLLFIVLTVWYLLTQTFHNTNSIDPKVPLKIESIQ